MRFSVTFADGHTDGLTLPGLTSTEVENCNGGNHHALRQDLKQQNKTETWKKMKQTRNYEEPKKH